MKLLSKYYRIYVLTALPLFLVVAVGYYFLLLTVITNKADESLMEDKAYIVSQLSNSGELVDLFLNLTDNYSLKSIKNKRTIKDQFTTIMLYDELEDEEEPYRQLYCTVSLNDQHYELTIRKSLVEYNSIMYSILILGTVFSLLLVMGFTLINRLLTRSVWSPFYRTIGELSDYSPESKKSIMLEETNIEEFQLLNRTVSRMSEKIKNDFFKQKKFIDNVAHEVQTPLSVINANVENLVQNKHLTQEDFLGLQNVSESTTYLSRVIKSLLLLSRIENDQFQELEEVSLVDYVILFFGKNKEHMENKGLTLDGHYDSEFRIRMHPVLLEILVSNLCQNAIRHSVPDSRIRVRSEEEKGKMKLTISNKSVKSDIDPDKMFEMFAKQSGHPESTGIGLSIVREICNLYGVQVSYKVEGERHTLELVK